MTVSPDHWTDRLRQTLRSYDEDLLRQVANRLCKPRNHWPVEELIDRCLGSVINPAVVDRRLKDLGPACRSVLAVIGHSRQPRWRVGNLVEMVVALGQPDGLQPIRSLFDSGLLYPQLSNAGDGRAHSRIRKFDTWLAHGQEPWVYAHPAVTGRALGGDLGLPECPGALTLDKGRTKTTAAIHEADGLEWPLRMAILWQQVAAAPLRRTQQRDFFKRDLDRLRSDSLLSVAPANNLSDVPDPGLLTVALALAEGLIEDRAGELIAGSIPGPWQEGLPATLASLWAALPHLEQWGPEKGWQPEASANPYPSAYLLSMMLLTTLPEGSWAPADALARWVIEHHPFWKSGDAGRGSRRQESTHSAAVSALGRFVLGMAYQLRMVQATRTAEGEWVVRLSPMGRWLLGLEDAPPEIAGFPQTLLAQPNLEILVYRQGLTPELIARLGRFATWKGLGAACTLQLEPDTVYRALESGETFETIVHTLERHSMKPTPAPVVEALRTWSNKRERISIYPSAALFEFASAADLHEALARGLPAVRLTDRLAVVADESSIDYRHFRLTGTRDYCLPPEKCVEVDADGVNLSIDLARSDLLLETELQRFAEPAGSRDNNNRRLYRITPATMAAGRANGLSVQALESWFWQRTGQSVSPAARLLLTAHEDPAPQLRRQLVLHVFSEEIADGLQQWPDTRPLIHDRLGPAALLVLEEHAAVLAERLKVLGMSMHFET